MTDQYLQAQVIKLEQQVMELQQGYPSNSGYAADMQRIMYGRFGREDTQGKGLADLETSNKDS